VQRRICLFLRATARNAIARFSYYRGVHPFLRLSVCHTLEPYQNGASWDREIFTVGCTKTLVHRDEILCLLGERIPLQQERKKGTPLKVFVLLLLAGIA